MTMLLFFSILISEKGVPKFWLNAMKTNEVLAEEVSILIDYC